MPKTAYSLCSGIDFETDPALGYFCKYLVKGRDLHVLIQEMNYMHEKKKHPGV